MIKYSFLLLVITLLISAVTVTAINIKKSEPVVGQETPQSSVLMVSIESSNPVIAARDCYQYCFDKISLKTDFCSQSNTTSCCYDDCSKCPKSFFGGYPCGYVYKPCAKLSELK